MAEQDCIKVEAAKTIAVVRRLLLLGAFAAVIPVCGAILVLALLLATGAASLTAALAQVGLISAPAAAASPQHTVHTERTHETVYMMGPAKKNPPVLIWKETRDPKTGVRVRHQEWTTDY